MNNIEKVTTYAMLVKEKYTCFMDEIVKNEDKQVFRSFFHLRPTSSENTTIVSTLPYAPMRGLPKVKINSLIEKLNRLYDLINILKTTSREETEKILIREGFKPRSPAFREENVQASLIRNIISKKYSDMIFIASEFELFDFGENHQTKRPDVLVYKNGVLYDIEIKNARNQYNR
jgi:hypothetical protein